MTDANAGATAAVRATTGALSQPTMRMPGEEADLVHTTGSAATVGGAGAGAAALATVVAAAAAGATLISGARVSRELWRAMAAIARRTTTNPSTSRMNAGTRRRPHTWMENRLPLISIPPQVAETPKAATRTLPPPLKSKYSRMPSSAGACRSLPAKQRPSSLRRNRALG